MSVAQCIDSVASIFDKSSSPKMVTLIPYFRREGIFHLQDFYNAILGNLRHDLSVNSWTSSQPIKRQRHNGISEAAPILTDLPNETIFHIMSNLDAHALKNIRKASKKLFYLTETFVGYEIRYNDPGQN